MRWLAVVLVLVAACAGTPERVAAPAGPRPPWCFEAVYGDERGSGRAWGCYESRGECRRALSGARELGRLVGVESLTRCEVR